MLDHPDGDFKIFQPRLEKTEYSISHYGDQWFIKTNKDDAENYKVMVTPEFGYRCGELERLYHT